MPKVKKISSTMREFVNNLDRASYFLSRINRFLIDLYNKKEFRKKINKNFPDFIGLSLSRLCGANCIFCPITKTQKHIKKRPFMDMKIIDKIIEELKERNFRGTLSLGENGDALLSPNFREIVKKFTKTYSAK